MIPLYTYTDRKHVADSMTHSTLIIDIQLNGLSAVEPGGQTGHNPQGARHIIQASIVLHLIKPSPHNSFPLDTLQGGSIYYDMS